MSSLRALPRGVRPVEGETPTSYLDRLAAANGITPSALWGHLRTADPSLPFKAAPEKATSLLETCGGIMPGWFAADRVRQLLPTRCPHHHWRLIMPCPFCGRPPLPISGCLPCADGAPTQVRSIGPVCLRHHTWHADNRNIHVGATLGYHRAEGVLRNRLFPLGVAASTGELQLASRLLTAWSADRPYRAVQLRRRAFPREARSMTDDDPFWVFPEAVALAQTLTDPGFVSYLLSPAWSTTLQAELLVAAVTGIVREAPPDDLSECAARIVDHGADSVRSAYAILGTRRHRHRAGFERILASTARSHRACLLRHLDATRLPAGTNAPTPPSVSHASRSTTIVRTDHRPDIAHPHRPADTSPHDVRRRWSDNPLTLPSPPRTPDVRWG